LKGVTKSKNIRKKKNPSFSWLNDKGAFVQVILCELRKRLEIVMNLLVHLKKEVQIKKEPPFKTSKEKMETNLERIN
jgi:hypothetical protein